MPKNSIVVVVVALLVSAVGYFGLFPAVERVMTVGGNPGGAVRNVPDIYTNGIVIGDQVRFAKTLTIGTGANQTSWKNNTGRDLIVDTAEISYSSGTASSSLRYYVATSTAASLTDYTRPSGNYLLIDGAAFATGTPKTVVVSTTTSNGVGAVRVPAGSYLNFMVQSVNGALCNGAACETATSTNRGITNFSAFFTGHYAP